MVGSFLSASLLPDFLQRTHLELMRRKQKLWITKMQIETLAVLLFVPSPLGLSLCICTMEEMALLLCEGSWDRKVTGSTWTMPGARGRAQPLVVITVFWVIIVIIIIIFIGRKKHQWRQMWEWIHFKISNKNALGDKKGKNLIPWKVNWTRLI